MRNLCAPRQIRNLLVTNKIKQKYQIPMEFWSDLKDRCPVNVDRLIDYAEDFESYVNVLISEKNLSNAKQYLIKSKGELDMMIGVLNQLLHDRTILRTNSDVVLQSWMIENLSNYMGEIERQQSELLLVHDNIKDNPDGLTVLKLSAYSTLLQVASKLVIFESLVKSIEEHDSLVEGKEVHEQEILKPVLENDGNQKVGQDGKPVFTKEVHKNVIEIKKDKRTFLYILFHILQVTLATLGGSSRYKRAGNLFTGKQSLNNMNVSWKYLISEEGQKRILEANKDETGINLPPELTNGAQHREEEEGEEVIYDEESEGKEEEEEDENV